VFKSEISLNKTTRRCWVSSYVIGQTIKGVSDRLACWVFN